ncbi:hypothetical protein [Paenibacillus periandrae]|uniref:hypothetical protein n=1 Tax=Paenibacillus periandrae TaxID=1761741 RepID=UPI001F0891D1|nr:hypothetical protein [Paenibacillus periandrae]
MNQLTKQISEWNQTLLAMDVASDEYSFYQSPEDLLLTEEKIHTWKESSGAGAIIVDAENCRYQIVVKSTTSIEGGCLEPTYGFINIDQAGWTLCDPEFPSLDVLIEWFAFISKNPIVEVIPSNVVEMLLNRDKVQVQSDGYYNVFCINPLQVHEWFCVPTMSALKNELFALEDAGYPIEKINIITPEGDRVQYTEMLVLIIGKPLNPTQAMHTHELNETNMLEL